MIPKRVYHIWLGDSGMPAGLRRCLDTWYDVLGKGGYEIVLIDLENIPSGARSSYLDCALACKSYTKASDYLRAKLLHDCGGIYLDADIAVIKLFDPLLDNGLFCGEEDEKTVNNAVLGSRSSHPLLRSYLDNVQEKFRGDDGLVREAGVALWSDLTKGWATDNRSADVLICPPRAFYPFHYSEKYSKACIMPETYAVHFWHSMHGLDQIPYEFPVTKCGS